MGSAEALGACVLWVPVSYGSRWFQVSTAPGEGVPGFLREGGLASGDI